MDFNGTYYLWDPRDGIDVGAILQQEAGMVRIEPGRLPDALTKLQGMVAKMGKARSVEIHCHGSPGRLNLGTHNGVNLRNAAWFGMFLNEATLPHALVEILACQVAAQEPLRGGPRSFLRTEPQNIVGYESEYHGRLQEIYMGKKWETDPAGVVLSGSGWKPTAIRPLVPNWKYIPDPQSDGLEFCRTLARAARATIRAAYSPQEEEAQSLDSDLTPMVSPIGNWEGPVFDFFPDRSVRCLGMSPYRSTSFGPIRVDIGGPLGVS
ncbi:MAG: hypothetical protein ABSH45_18230 [Bryobacteraceae bacterium]|jgi:hypothetical protein